MVHIQLNLFKFEAMNIIEPSLSECHLSWSNYGKIRKIRHAFEKNAVTCNTTNMNIIVWKKDSNPFIAVSVIQKQKQQGGHEWYICASEALVHQTLPAPNPLLCLIPLSAPSLPSSLAILAEWTPRTSFWIHLLTHLSKRPCKQMTQLHHRLQEHWGCQLTIR